MLRLIFMKVKVIMCWLNRRDLKKKIKFLIAFLIPVAAVMVMNNGLDNDSWYMLAEGREIVNNGIYYEDQLSIHEGLNVTVQNYGFAVIFYLLYSVFGGVGVYIAMLVVNGVLCYLIYKICMLISNKNTNLSLILMILTDLLLAYCFVVTRAQVVSYVIFMSIIYFLELYARKGDRRVLWWIPVLSFLQINLHASLWPMILIVLIVYMIDGVKQPRLKYKGYKIKPLIIILLASFGVGFLNPYGLKMITFILTSYGIPEANDYINEMQPFRTFASNYDILLYGAIVAVLISYIFGKNKNIRIRYLLMMFGFLALGLNTFKGMSQVILVLLFPMAEVYKNVRIVKWRRVGRIAAMWTGVLAIMTVGTYLVVVVPDTNNDTPGEVMAKGIDAMDLAVGEINKNDLRVYADYNMGGYVEYRGYKAYIDPRMEVFIKSNNGKEEIFKEYYDLQHREVDKKEFISKYNFDYGDEYDLIFKEDESEDDSDGVKVYKKKEQDYIKI